MENLLENFREKNFLLAVSGGADSMVLTNLMMHAGCKFQVAHMNYKLRAEDADLDQKVVEKFCKTHDVKLHIYEVSEKDKKPEGSIQLWARDLRYSFFRKIQKQENIDYLVTAHHLNDQLETFIINLSRGSGIKGLSGIPAKENNILRPLLNFSKDEIYRFANENNIQFREDLSNQKNDYLRNKVRNKIILEITTIFPHFLESFSDSVNYLKFADEFIQNAVEQRFKEIFVSGNNDEFILNRVKLLASEEFITKEIIRKLGFSGDEIEKVKNSENGKFFRSKTHEISIKKSEIRCKKRRN